MHKLENVVGRADKYNKLRKLGYMCSCGESFKSLGEFRIHSK